MAIRMSRASEYVRKPLDRNRQNKANGSQMLVAYVLEHIIGLSTSLAFCVSRPWQQENRQQIIPQRSLRIFHDCATFLTFSIQVAAIVVLVKVDFGISTNDMGDATVRITQAVSALTLLPLVYGIVLLHSFGSVANDGQIVNERLEACSDLEEQERKEQSTRFSLFILCWMLALYPFYSKLNSVFGSNKIGTSLISIEQFDVIQGFCFEDITPISPVEDHLMTALAILSFVPLSILILGCIVLLGLRKHHKESKIYWKLSSALAGRTPRAFLRWVPAAVLGMVPIFACGLLWTVIRVQRFQSAMAATIGSEDVDGQWTFGQVVAVTVFAPVIVDIWDSFYSRQKER